MKTNSKTSQHFSPDEFDAFSKVQTAAVQRSAYNLLPQGLKTPFDNKILLWKITDALLLSSKPSTTTLTKEEVRLHVAQHCVITEYSPAEADVDTNVCVCV